MSLADLRLHAMGTTTEGLATDSRRPVVTPVAKKVPEKLMAEEPDAGPSKGLKDPGATTAVG
jgi:hypothetical protein